MKLQHVTSLVLVLFLCNPLFAGDGDTKKGIRGGFQSSNFYANNNSAEVLNSFYVGFVAERKLIPLLHIGSGLEFNQSGYTESILGSKYTFKRSNLSIPIYAKVKVGPVFATGGISPQFGVGNSLKIDDNKEDLEDDEKTNVFDAPVHLGLGIQILMFSIDARYNWGLSNLSKTSGDIKQQYFQLGAQIAF